MNQGIRRFRHLFFCLFPLFLLFLIPRLHGGEAYPPEDAQSPLTKGGTKADYSQLYLTPRQGHVGPEIYPVHIDNHETISAYVKKYSKSWHLEWIFAAYERGFPYRDFIIEKLHTAGAPYELIFLPIVESEYKNTTVSRSGAVGLWQFMLNSIYPNMYVNQWMDDRKNFWKATEAAVDKLLYNYEKLQDWLLALAAYNCGLGKVSRTIESSGISDYWELCDKGLLPQETINYVPKFCAITKILSYPGRFNSSHPWRQAVAWERIPLDQAVDLRILAEHSGVPYNILAMGNNELYYAISPPDNVPFNLKIPAEYTDQIKKTLEDENFRLLRFYVYKINRGDTLYALALHYGVSVEMIAKYNPGIQPKSLQIGQTIVIPALKQVQPYESPATTEEPVEIANDPRPYIHNYTVQRGDTLWSIARKYDTSVALLTARNSLSEKSILQPGQKLLVPKE